MLRRMVFVSFVAVLAVGAGSAAWANGVIFPQPTDEIPNPNPLRIQSSQISVKITDNVATTHVNEVVVNPNSGKRR